MIVKHAELHDAHDPAQIARAKSIAAKHLPLWEKFERIHVIMKDVGVMSKQRVAELEKTGPAFVALFRSTFPDQHISLKLHVIETHLVEWAKRYSSIGLFAEDAGESLHALIMRYERQYACLKGAAKDKIIWAKLREVGDAELQAADAARRHEKIKRKE